MLNLDDLDVRIVREFGSPSSPQWNVRESYANVARKLGVDEETVRLRMKRMKERGYLPAWPVTVNPHLLGREAVNLELEVDDERTKPRAISQLKLVEGITRIVDFSGKGLLVTMYSEKGESLSRKTRLIESICGSPAVGLWRSRFPRPELRMRRVDWKIVNALRDDARQDLDDVAKSLGVTSRTVQRRLSAMNEGKAIYLSSGPNVEMAGGLMCCYHIYCPDHLKKGAVDSVIRSGFTRVGHLDTSPENHSVFGRHCENLADADKVLAKLRSVDGVQDAKMNLMKEVIVVQDWLKDEIGRRISVE